MRLALITALTVTAALIADMQGASSQESFFNERFCSRPIAGDDEGGTNCAFHTWEQCIASARGEGRWCTTNPWWHGPRQQPKTQGKNRRRNR
jgi:hypothetical protein